MKNSYQILSEKLFSFLVDYKCNGKTLKECEVCLQQIVEEVYPEYQWWELLDGFSIYENLMAYRDPAMTAMIIQHLLKEKEGSNNE